MKEKILVIDDNPLNRKVFDEALGHAWDITSAGSLEEAFKILDEEEISLIVLDVIIDGTTAFDFMARLSQTSHGLDIPVVYLTSMEERHEMHRAMRLGGSDYIYKPLDLQEIQMTIRNQMKLLGK